MEGASPGIENTRRASPRAPFAFKYFSPFSPSSSIPPPRGNDLRDSGPPKKTRKGKERKGGMEPLKYKRVKRGESTCRLVPARRPCLLFHVRPFLVLLA